MSARAGLCDVWVSSTNFSPLTKYLMDFFKIRSLACSPLQFTSMSFHNPCLSFRDLIITQNISSQSTGTNSVTFSLSGRPEDAIVDMGWSSRFSELGQDCPPPFEQVEPGRMSFFLVSNFPMNKKMRFLVHNKDRIWLEKEVGKLLLVNMSVN